MALKSILIKLGIIDGKKTERGLANVDKSIKNIAKSALKAGAAFFATRGMIRGMSSSVQLAANFEGVERGFNNLARSAGFSAQAFENFRSATDGTMGSIELMTQANNAMLLGITDSEDQMVEMFDIAQRLAQALGKDAAFGVESLITGLGRQSKLMLDNLGIMIDVEKANKDHAKTLNKVASSLTDQEKKQAFVNATMKSARKLVSNLGEEQLTSLDKMKQFTTSIDDMKIALGGAVTEAMTPFVESVNDKLQELGDIGWDNVGQAMATNLSTILGFAGRSASISAQIAGMTIMRGLSQGLSDSLPAISTTLDAIGQFFGALKGMITGVPPAVASMGVAIKQSLEDAGFDETGFKIAQLKQGLIDLGLEGFEFVKVKSQEYKDESKEGGKTNEDLGSSTNDLEGSLNSVGFTYDKLKENVLGFLEANQKGLESSLKGLAMSQNLGDASRALANQYIVEGVFSAAKSALVKVPFPFNLAAAAAAAVAANALFNEIIPVKKAATGFDGIVNQPTMFMTGEAGPESVQVTPLTPGMNQNGPQSNVTVNITGGIIQDDYVRNTLIPALNRATGTGTRLNA